jgi:hypothetical protein
MATKKIYDLSVVVGKYTNRDGQEKNRYQNIGVMMQKDDGGKFMFIEPWFNPAGCPHEPGRGIMISMFEPKGGNDGNPRAETGASEERFEDDIPF